MATITHEQSPNNPGPLHVTAHPDSGAQVLLTSPSLLSQLGLGRKHPLPITQLIRAVGGTPLQVVGYVSTSAFDYTIRTTWEVIYNVRGVFEVFLSLPA